jgi:arginine N-succinyltransferase
MLVVRAARLSDLETLLDLARQSGPGFTSLPVDAGQLRNRLAAAEQAFSQTDAKPEAKYLLMLEDSVAGEICGTAGIKARVGVDKPFFNYRILSLTHASQQAARRIDLRALVLVNDYTGCTEVGSLFLKADRRKGGAGRLLAQSRYLLMAAAPHLFAREVVAELRGVVDKQGRAPFWEHLGRYFFDMTFEEADHLSAIGDNQFILDLMPRFPIYVDLLDEEAVAVMGQCHADGQGALRLLEWEGFTHDRVIDVFDGGPLVSCPLQEIRTVRESHSVTVAALGADDPAIGLQDALVSTDALHDFRVVKTEARREGSVVYISDEALAALGLKVGDKARAWLRSA